MTMAMQNDDKVMKNTFHKYTQHFSIGRKIVRKDLTMWNNND